MEDADAILAKKIEETCNTGDYERDHWEADKLVIERLRLIGYAKTVDAWTRVGKWYA